MNRRQINWSHMYGAVGVVFEKYASVIDQFPEMGSAIQQFNSRKEVISQHAQVQVVNFSGLTRGKIDLRDLLTMFIQRLSAALAAYATSKGNITLKMKLNFSSSFLKRKSDQVLLEIARALLTEAKPFSSEFKKYGITDIEFDEMVSVIGEFDKAVPKKRGADNVTKLSTKIIAEIFKELNKLLRERIDVLMGPLEFTNPDFYYTYKNARIIVDYSGRKPSKKNDDDTPKPQ